MRFTLSEIFQQELPPGVLNVISGYGEECGEPLVTHEKVRKVTFTGSFTVGKIIAKKAAPEIMSCYFRTWREKSKI